MMGTLACTIEWLNKRRVFSRCSSGFHNVIRDGLIRSHRFAVCIGVETWLYNTMTKSKWWLFVPNHTIKLKWLAWSFTWLHIRCLHNGFQSLSALDRGTKPTLWAALIDPLIDYNICLPQSSFQALHSCWRCVQTDFLIVDWMWTHFEIPEFGSKKDYSRNRGS